MKVVVYSTKNCPRCKALKRALKRAKIKFTVKSIEDTDAMADLVMKNIHLHSAPAIQIGKLVFTFTGDM